MTKNKKIDNSQVDTLFKAFDTAPTEIKQGRSKQVPLKKIINNFRNIYINQMEKDLILIKREL